MEITSNNLLNILLPNDNKVLKEALKQADVQQLLSGNKSGNIQDVLKGLFDDITQQTKSNETVQNILKNTNLFKEMGNFPKELQTLLSTVKSSPALQQFQAPLEKFMLNISNMSEENIKSQINNSGLFLEAKLAKATGALPNNITQTLNELKSALQQSTLPNKEMALNLIDKLLTTQGQANPTQTLNDMKSLLNSLKELSVQLQSPQNATSNSVAQLVNKLETLLSKELPQMANMQMVKPETATELKNTLTQLQSQIPASNTALHKEMSQLLDKLSNPNTQNAALLLSQGKEVLQTLKQLPQVQAALSYNTQTNLVGQLATKLENILSQLSQTPTMQAAQAVQSNATQTMSMKPEVLSDIKNILTQLQPAMASLNQTNTNEVMQLIQKVLTQATQNNPALLNNSLQELFNNIKSNESLQNLLQNSTQMKELGSLITKFEALVGKEVINNPLFTNPSNNPAVLKESLSMDMKAILLKVQQEIAANPASIQNAQDSAKQVDKMLMQIDYSQLMSHTSNSNYVYVPFMWNLLEEGTISTTKTDQEKFYCEINLKLKEYGKLNLLLGIYNTNNLDITILAQKESLKEQIQQNMQDLKKRLNNVGLIPLNVKLLDLQEKDEKQEVQTNAFNDYSQDLNLGLNIRV